MKRILFLLLLTVSVYGQNPSRFAKIQITGNANSATATKVNVQEANGEVNTQTINTGFNKNIGLGGSDVVGATTLLNQYSTTPIEWTATAFNSGQVVFFVGKQWISKIATVAGDVPAVSSKWEEITFDALANKTTTVDQTIIDGSTNSVSGNAVFDGLALKSNIGHTHVASQITDLSKASVGLGNVDNTSDLSKPLSTATQTALNGKENSFTKNTAFNKNFGTTAGTVVEGGTLGSNAYNSTAYLPLTGGTLTGKLTGSQFNFTSSNNNFIASDLTIGYASYQGYRFAVNGTGYFNGNLNVNSILRVGDHAYNSTIDQAGIGKITSEFTNSRSYTKFYGHTGAAENYLILSIDGLGNSIFTGAVTATSYNGSATLTGTPTAPTAPAGTNTTQIATTAFVQAAAIPYKVYTFYVNQSGANIPTSVMLSNNTTLPSTPTWERAGVGDYRFVIGKVNTTKVFPYAVQSSWTFGNDIYAASVQGDYIQITRRTNGVLTDGLINILFEIRQYP